MSRNTLTLFAMLAVPVLLVAQDAAEKHPTTAPAAVSDLLVMLEHVGGTKETFKDEVERMELIVDAAGKLSQVHLITRSGNEADTHVWYNVNNLVAVRYQFLAITGKGKVSVRTTTPPTLKPPKDVLKKDLQAIEPEDYR